MQKIFFRKGYPVLISPVLILFGYLILVTGYKNSSENHGKDQSDKKLNSIIETEVSQAYIKYDTEGC
jgi:hypothetical protein